MVAEFAVPHLPLEETLFLRAPGAKGFTVHSMQAHSVGDECAVFWRPPGVTSTHLYIFGPEISEPVEMANFAAFQFDSQLFDLCPQGFVVTPFGYVRKVVAINRNVQRLGLTKSYPCGEDFAIIVDERVAAIVYARNAVAT